MKTSKKMYKSKQVGLDYWWFVHFTSLQQHVLVQSSCFPLQMHFLVAHFPLHEHDTVSLLVVEIAGEL